MPNKNDLEQKEYRMLYARKYREKNRERDREKNLEYGRKYRAEHKDRIRELTRRWIRQNSVRNNELNVAERDRLKLAVFTHYAINGEIKCCKCGFNDLRALTIDHIDNNGAEERRRLFGHRMYAGTTFYRWLRKNNYPNNGYQILCANCNWIKKVEYNRCRK
jgi:hypothetical protein